MVGQPRVVPHGLDAVEVHRDRLAGRTGLRRVTALVAPADLELLEPVVVRDLLPIGVEDVLVAVPDFATRRALALLDDLLQRGQRRTQIVDRDQSRPRCAGSGPRSPGEPDRR